MDWTPDDATVALMLRTFAPNAILAVHDYAAGRDELKGNLIVKLLGDTYCQERPGAWTFPSSSPAVMADGTRINGATAFFVPDAEPKGLSGQCRA